MPKSHFWLTKQNEARHCLYIMEVVMGKGKMVHIHYHITTTLFLGQRVGRNSTRTMSYVLPFVKKKKKIPGRFQTTVAIKCILCLGRNKASGASAHVVQSVGCRTVLWPEWSRGHHTNGNLREIKKTQSFTFKMRQGVFSADMARVQQPWWISFTSKSWKALL